MAGKAKSVYLTITPKGKLQSVFTKVFFDAKGLREFLALPEVIEKYPTELFDIVKETY